MHQPPSIQGRLANAGEVGFSGHVQPQPHKGREHFVAVIACCSTIQGGGGRGGIAMTTVPGGGAARTPSFGGHPLRPRSRSPCLFVGACGRGQWPGRWCVPCPGAAQPRQASACAAADQSHPPRYTPPRTIGPGCIHKKGLTHYSSLTAAVVRSLRHSGAARRLPPVKCAPVLICVRVAKLIAAARALQRA